jgi:integrase
MSTYKGKVRKIGETWFYDVYIDGVRERKAVGPNKRDAEDELERIKGKALSGEYRAGRRRKVRFESFADEYIKHAKPNKRSWKRDEVSLNSLKPFFKGLYLFKISARKIEEYKRKRLEEVMPATVNRELALLKTMFNLAIKWKLIYENPVKAVKSLQEPKHKYRILNEDEAKRFIMAASASASKHLKPIILIALNTGMRRGEILSLRWHDIHLDEKYIEVRPEIAKSGKRRLIPINGMIEDALNRVERNGEFVFCNTKTGKPLTTVRKAFLTACDKAKIGYVRFHDLRHTAGTWMVMSGIDLVTVKEILGHASIETTMRYAHPTPETKRRAVEVLGAIFDLESEKMVKKWSNREDKEGVSAVISASYKN